MNLSSTEGVTTEAVRAAYAAAGMEATRAGVYTLTLGDGTPLHVCGAIEALLVQAGYDAVVVERMMSGTLLDTASDALNLHIAYVWGFLLGYGGRQERPGWWEMHEVLGGMFTPMRLDDYNHAWRGHEDGAAVWAAL